MKRLIFRVCLGLLLVVLLGAVIWQSMHPAPPPGVEGWGNLDSPRQPNIVLISLDGLRPDHLGAAGYPRLTSPNIDRFASQGMLFRNARSTAPSTLVSHMSVMTSLIPSSSGVDGLNKALPPPVPTLAQLLQHVGYDTAALVDNHEMSAQWGFDRGFALWREFESGSPQARGEHITQQALQWLRSPRPAERPFFLFLHYNDLQEPYDAPEPWREKFEVELSRWQRRHLLWQARRPEVTLPSLALREQLIAAYDAQLAWLDSQVGQLLAALPSDTVVLLFSGHGEAFEEHGWTLHGASLFEEEIRVPLILGATTPGMVPAHVAGHAVSLLDVAPTLLQLAGMAPPEHFEGRSLLVGGPFTTPPPLPQLASLKSPQQGRISQAVMLPPWKLIYDPLAGRLDLYQLPDELHPLPRSSWPAAAGDLQQLLTQWTEVENFWLLHVGGMEQCEIELVVESGQIATLIPDGVHPQDDLQLLGNAQGVLWRTHPGQGQRRLYFELMPANVRFRISARAGEGGTPLQLRAGDQSIALPLPAQLQAGGSQIKASSPLIVRAQADAGASGSAVTQPTLQLFWHAGNAAQQAMRSQTMPPSH